MKFWRLSNLIFWQFLINFVTTWQILVKCWDRSCPRLKMFAPIGVEWMFKHTKQLTNETTTKEKLLRLNETYQLHQPWCCLWEFSVDPGVLFFPYQLSCQLTFHIRLGPVYLHLYVTSFNYNTLYFRTRLLCYFPHWNPCLSVTSVYEKCKNAYSKKNKWK